VAVDNRSKASEAGKEKAGIEFLSSIENPSSRLERHAMKPQTTATLNYPILSSTEAQLYVADVNASCAFFTSKLGFEIGFVSGDPPFYGQVHRDNARLNLRMVCEPVFVGDIREREHLLSASITVSTAVQIKALFIEFQAAGVRFAQTLKKEPWGAKTFIVVDPDGNLILFAGPAK
jgi:catechol 2,3-dioxygenase-like lactoylglutathione lyase family enzyme